MPGPEGPAHSRGIAREAVPVLPPGRSALWFAALYVNVFVLIVQAFLKVPALNAAAPTQTELPFKVTQLVVLAMFVALGTLAVINFHVEPIR